uniref:CPG4 domain-containing protein n=1 Tax=Steinernema glaseri TaxID=37863 RepID=A0A1I7Y2N1_9BILA
MCRPTVLLLSVFFILVHADVFDQVASQGKGVLNGAYIRGENVRQCSCSEQAQCVENMKAQALECIDPCWKQFTQVTDRPDDLRKCFDTKDHLLQNFLSCFESNVEACVPDQNGPSIPKVNISEILRLTESRLGQKKDQLSSTLVAPIKKIVDAAGDFALCLKTCFLSKNANGYCFDRVGCQPLVAESKAKKSFKQCTRSINWKKEAGELCECAVKAGLNDLNQYCPMFRLMGNRRPHHH